MKKDEYKTVIREEAILTREVVLCDKCNKKIYARDIQKGRYPTEYASYFSVTTGHHDWGNDSIDSIETMDICSPECLRKVLDSYCECYGGDNSQYVNIEHEVVGL